jgi:hypothetical protein
MISVAPKRVSLIKIQNTPEYGRLTGKQKLWVSTYIAGGEKDGNYDPVYATKVAYECKSKETARVMSYSLVQNIRIAEILNMHFNKSPNEEFLRDLDRAVKNKHLTPSQLGALRIKAELFGYGSRIPDNQRFGVIPKDVQQEAKERRKKQRAKPVKVAEESKSKYPPRPF